MRHIGIMRHGDAPYINGERQISNLGHQQIKQMAKWYAEHLKGQGLTLETLLVSPILRAQQTAETFETTFKTLVDYDWCRETEPLLKSESIRMTHKQPFTLQLMQAKVQRESRTAV